MVDTVYSRLPHGDGLVFPCILQMVNARWRVAVSSHPPMFTCRSICFFGDARPLTHDDVAFLVADAGDGSRGKGRTGFDRSMSSNHLRMKASGVVAGPKA